MKKLLLLLFISFILCFGCDPDDDDSMLTYNCVNDDCFAEEGGQYATLQDCLSVCDINSSDINSNFLMIKLLSNQKESSFVSS